MIVSAVAALALFAAPESNPAADGAAMASKPAAEAKAKPRKVCYDATPSGSRLPRKVCTTVGPASEAKSETAEVAQPVSAPKSE